MKIQKASLLSSFIRIAFFLLLMWPSSAYAYLDPATGSAIIQGLIAGLAAAVVALRVYWAAIKRWFSRFGSTPDGQSGGGDLADHPRPTDER